MSSYAYYDGKFGKREDITIPLSNRSIFFGDAVYDAAIGSYDRILWEDEHIRRFLNNAKKLGMKHTLSKKQLSSLLREIAVKSMLDSYFIYFQLSRCSEARVHSAACANGSSLLVTIEPINIPKRPEPLRLITTEDMRYGYCDVKTVNLLPAVLSATEAEARGCDEAVFVKNNVVTECTKSNISIIKQGRLITHPKSNSILPGIAREHLLLSCGKLGIPYCEERFTVNELMAADEIIVTSTTKLARRVKSINGVSVGGADSGLCTALCDCLYTEYEDFCRI